MSRLVISSAGTWGDILPFVALGKRLQSRGHDVRLALNPAMIPAAVDAGLNAIPCGKPFGEAEARAEAAFFDYWTPVSLPDQRQLWTDLDIEGNYRDLLQACQNADLLIASWLQEAAPLVHERLKIPWITVVLQPMHFDVPARPAEELPPRSEWQEFLNEVRVRLGFSALAAGDGPQQDWSSRLLLLASSQHFSEPLFDKYPQAHITGFWLADKATDWQPDPALSAFLDPGPPPLLLTFGSIPVPRVPEVLQVHLEASQKVQRRLLVQRGWADLLRDTLPVPADPAAVHFTDYAPHEWLFPRVAAVIHHGGIGTLAQALRCGCPVVVEPYAHDQFFNARRVLALQVGTAMHPHRLTADGLAQALTHRVLTEETRDHVRQLAARLRQEDGLGRACELIERQLAT